MTAETALFVNGRCIMDNELASLLSRQRSDAVFMSDGEVVAARVSDKALHAIDLAAETIDESVFAGLPVIAIDARLMHYPWDLLYANETEIGNDFALLVRKRPARYTGVHRAAVLVKRNGIYLGARSHVGAGAVLDASEGPIFIGEGAKVFPAAVIEGPCYVGAGSLIKIGAKIYGNTSIGPMSKIGGEVEHSIVHSHANKQHDGFLGHSYLGMWVNLGAGTTTSNLKNTYGSVKVRVGKDLVDTGKMFVGLTAGDHVKTGINSTLDTGTIIGPSSNIFGTAIPPKYIPPFSWGSANSFETYDVEKALSVAVRVMSRRNVEASTTYQELFRRVYQMTNDERSKN